jgi:cytidine deaminase
LKVDAKTAALVRAAVDARESAYAPYSQFKVGAALLAEDGRVFTGVNVENRSYGLTICAERNAVAAAVAAGARAFTHVVIATGILPAAPPCGACREVLAEFAPDLAVLLVGNGQLTRRLRLGKLLPEQFVFKPRKRT